MRASGSFYTKCSLEQQQALDEEYARWKALTANFVRRYCFDENGVLGPPRVEPSPSSGLGSATNSAIRSGKGTSAMVDVQGRYKVPLDKSEDFDEASESGDKSSGRRQPYENQAFVVSDGELSDAGESTARKARTVVGEMHVEKPSTLSDADEATTRPSKVDFRTADMRHKGKGMEEKAEKDNGSWSDEGITTADLLTAGF
jgi:hypothetical protein